MRALEYILIVALLLVVACTSLEMESSRKLRSDCFNRNTRQRVIPKEGEMLPNDTTLFYSVVQFDKSYDWRRDSLMGEAHFSIDYFVDNEHILSIGSKDFAVSDPDTHHILYGSLFTQKSSADSTFISKNGRLFLKYKGRELLKGMLIINEDIYTLCSLRSGKGFTYRKNGELIFTHNDGYIMGDMNDASYPDTGALYIDNDKRCFCYYTISNGRNRYFSVINDKEKELDISKAVDDIKLINGKEISTNCGYNVEDARLWRRGNSYVISAYIQNQCSGIINEKGEMTRLCQEKATMLVGKSKLYGVFTTEDGLVVNCSVGINIKGNATGDMVKKSLDLATKSREEYGNSFVLSPSCISICDDTPLIAITSIGNSPQSNILVGEDMIPLSLNGYVSRVYMSISPPN